MLSISVNDIETFKLNDKMRVQLRNSLLEKKERKRSLYRKAMIKTHKVSINSEEMQERLREQIKARYTEMQNPSEQLNLPIRDFFP